MKVLRSISAIILATITLVSSTSFMVGVHYCGGKAQNIALFDKAAPCEMEQSLPPCHRHMTAECCQDSAVIHDGDEFSSAKISVELAPAFVMEMVPPAILLDEVISADASSGLAYYNYDPPLRAPDLTIALRVFLI